MTAYTDNQLAAIHCVDQPVQIIACAGSGKTQVISQRIANLLASGQAEPRNIVAFTFTEKAAAELKDRITHLVEAAQGTAIGLAEMFIGTMHGYCLNLLQRYVPATFKLNTLTDVTNRLLVDRYSSQSGLTGCPLLADPSRHLQQYTDTQLYLSVLGILREEDVDAARVPPQLRESLTQYLRLLHDKAYLDYTSMISLVVELLEEAPDNDPLGAALFAHVRDDLEYLVVDEYQDVNPLQERLINALTQFGANLCVVGDDDQTIYQWRGSDVENILTFADRRKDVRQITLSENFRSSEGVIRLADSVTALIPADQRLPKEMRAAGHQHWQRGDLLALTFNDEGEEANWICDRIEAMRGVAFTDAPGTSPRGMSWSDFAVLYRSVAHDAGPLVDEMRSRGIPFLIKGLTRLFDAPEIQAVVQIFHYIVGDCDADALHEAWTQANLLPHPAKWRTALAVLDRDAHFEAGERWGRYNIQQLYLDFLEALGIREDTVPGQPARRELAFYQLGKFSQVISDFEEINFSSDPVHKYQEFANWLDHQAPSFYEDAEQDVGYATPDAVVISTVHQAKGMQWPAVFIPCLRRNRFPAARMGGRNVFHVIPKDAVPHAERYRGTVEDETRLFYVAITRAQKYLFLSFSPGWISRYQKPSSFFTHATRQAVVTTRDPGVPRKAPRLTPRAKVETPQMTLTFSELKYYFECPYQFKIRFLYGFNPPIHEALGYGKGLHDALAEVHKRALEGDLLSEKDAADLVDRHLNTPYAYPRLRKDLERSAKEAIQRYLRDHGAELPNTLHSEEPIQVHLDDGIIVEGRIDLIRRLDTGEVSIVDFKSTERAQAEDVTRDQLHTYAVGYQELTGQRADLIEVLNLDPGAKSTREVVDDKLLRSVGRRISEAGKAIRSNDLNPHPSWKENSCSTCDFRRMCVTGQAHR